MLREPQHERNFPNHFKPPSVRHFDRLSAGSELRRRTPNEFFQQTTLLAQPIPSIKTVRSRSMALSVIRVRS